MKAQDNFEQRLRCQPLRKVPSAWREEILVAADVNRRTATAPSVSEDQAALIAGWRLIFGRLPLAWASLAALWVVIIGANLTLPCPFVSVAALGTPSASFESLAALDLPLADYQSPAGEFTPASDVAPVRNPPATPRRPRSERRPDMDAAEMDAQIFGNSIT